MLFGAIKLDEKIFAKIDGRKPKIISSAYRGRTFQMALFQLINSRIYHN